jgi:hypothetical protein
LTALIFPLQVTQTATGSFIYTSYTLGRLKIHLLLTQLSQTQQLSANGNVVKQVTSRKKMPYSALCGGCCSQCNFANSGCADI